MHKVLTASLGIMACLSLATALPTWADAPAQPVVAKPAQKSTPLSGRQRALMAPGFCLGLIIGTPICFARKLPQETIKGARGLVGSIVDNDSIPWLVAPAAVCWLPPATIISLVEAPAYAWRNAWMADQPFSKEQFSLGTLDEAD